MFWKKVPIDTTEIDNLRLKIDVQNVTIGELKEELEKFKQDFDEYREGLGARLNQIKNLVEIKLDGQEEKTELLLIQIEKAFEEKINALSPQGTLVTDLLRKIAKLETITDAVESRRSTKDILDKIGELDSRALKANREDLNDKEAKDKIIVLKWALGEDFDI